ncbi:hypothetical protein JCM3774_000871 [Rhodotorula dairenensis]
MVLARHPALRSPLHRIPVLWSLYRPLLRAARQGQLQLPADRVSALQNYIRQGFRQGRHLVGLDKVRRKLVEAEQLLEQFKVATESPAKANQIQRLAAHLAAREALRIPSQPRRPVPVHRPKPRVYPSIMHATQFYHPVPRLRPQPIEITMTIFNRRRTSQRRYDKLELANEWVKYARAEEQFEQELVRRASKGRSSSDDGGGGGGGGKTPLDRPRLGDEWRDWIKDAREREKREMARSKLRISPELQEKARAANRIREERRRAAASARKKSSVSVS